MTPAPEPDKAQRWVWAPHEDGDWMDTFDSREAAEEYGRTEGVEIYSDEDHSIDGLGWVAPLKPIDVDRIVRMVADAAAIVESMDEQDDVGCAFEEPVFQLRDGAQEALEELMVMWAARYVTQGGKFLVGRAYKVEPNPPDEPAERVHGDSGEAGR